MKQEHVYKIDLTKMDGNGDFACPRCGTEISPDDETESAYTILGSKANTNGLQEIEICCNKCTSHIHLTGFSVLQDLENAQKENKRQQQNNQVCYITHI
jgi:hypothetical protein